MIGRGKAPVPWEAIQMFLVAGGGSKMDDCGAAQDVRCPRCGRIGRVHVYKQYSYVSVFFIPVVKMNPTYLAVCEDCTGSWKLSKEAGKEFERTSFLSMGDAEPFGGDAPSDGQIRYCGQCGKAIRPGDLYCSGCGKKLF